MKTGSYHRGSIPSSAPAKYSSLIIQCRYYFQYIFTSFWLCCYLSLWAEHWHIIKWFLADAFSNCVIIVIITNWKRKDHLNVGVYKQNWQWTLNEDPLNAKSDISETESSQDIICFNTPFMSDATFKVSVEYISSSQHINENSREKNIDARVWTATKTGNERRSWKIFAMVVISRYVIHTFSKKC